GEPRFSHSLSLRALIFSMCGPGFEGRPTSGPWRSTAGDTTGSAAQAGRQNSIRAKTVAALLLMTSSPLRDKLIYWVGQREGDGEGDIPIAAAFPHFLIRHRHAQDLDPLLPFASPGHRHEVRRCIGLHYQGGTNHVITIVFKR